jgi:hypothetical protein
VRRNDVDDFGGEQGIGDIDGMTEDVRGSKIATVFLNLSADVRRIDKFIRKVSQFYDEKAEGRRRRRSPVPRKKNIVGRGEDSE